LAEVLVELFRGVGREARELGNADLRGDEGDAATVLRRFQDRALLFRVGRAVAVIVVLSLALLPVAADTADLALWAIPPAAAAWYLFKRVGFRNRWLSGASEPARAASSLVELTAFGAVLIYLAIAHGKSDLALELLLVWPVYRVRKRLPGVPWWIVVGFTMAFIAFADMVASGWALARANEPLLAVVWFAVLYATFSYQVLDTWSEENILLSLKDVMPLGRRPKLEQMAETARKAVLADLAVIQLEQEDPGHGGSSSVEKSFNPLLDDQTRRDLDERYRGAFEGADLVARYRSTTRTFHRAIGARCFYGSFKPADGSPEGGGSPGRSYITVAMLLASREEPTEVAGTIFLHWLGRPAMTIERREALDMMAQVLATDLAQWQAELARQEVSQIKERRDIVAKLHGTVTTKLSLAESLILVPISQGGLAEGRTGDQARQRLLDAFNLVRDSNSSLALLADGPQGPTCSTVLRQLQKLAELLKFTVPTPPRVRFDGWADEVGIQNDSELNRLLYQMVAEAMTNAVRHSGASRVTVTWSCAPTGFRTIRVEDDGHGMSSTEGSPSGGLQGMRQQARECGGDCMVVTSADGTTIIFTIPMQADPR
jgi:signal transduction histidine kinase